MKRGQLPHRVADETPEQKAARETRQTHSEIALDRPGTRGRTVANSTQRFPSDKLASLLAGPHSTD